MQAKLIGVRAQSVGPDKLLYRLEMKPPKVFDVARREIHLTVDSTQHKFETDPWVSNTFDFQVYENQAVVVYLVDVDEAGNRSAPSKSLSFRAVDTIPPPAPDEPTVTQVEEIGSQGCA